MDESARPEATVIRIDPRCTPTGQQPSESSQSPLPTKDVHAIMQTKTAPIRSASEGTEMDITKVSGPNTAKCKKREQTVPATPRIGASVDAC